MGGVGVAEGCGLQAVAVLGPVHALARCQGVGDRDEGRGGTVGDRAGQPVLRSAEGVVRQADLGHRPQVENAGERILVVGVQRAGVGQLLAGVLEGAELGLAAGEADHRTPRGGFAGDGVAPEPGCLGPGAASLGRVRELLPQPGGGRVGVDGLAQDGCRVVCRTLLPQGAGEAADRFGAAGKAVQHLAPAFGRVRPRAGAVGQPGVSDVRPRLGGEGFQRLLQRRAGAIQAALAEQRLGQAGMAPPDRGLDLHPEPPPAFGRAPVLAHLLRAGELDEEVADVRVLFQRADQEGVAGLQVALLARGASEACRPFPAVGEGIGDALPPGARLGPVAPVLGHAGVVDADIGIGWEADEGIGHQGLCLLRQAALAQGAGDEAMDPRVAGALIGEAAPVAFGGEPVAGLIGRAGEVVEQVGVVGEAGCGFAQDGVGFVRAASRPGRARGMDPGAGVRGGGSTKAVDGADARRLGGIGDGRGGRVRDCGFGHPGPTGFGGC